jgi:hypothetical protein
MTDLQSWQRLLLGTLALLLVLALPACACADELERMINELIAQLIAELEQAIHDWWQGLVEDIQRQITEWWEGVKRDLAQKWQDTQDSLRSYWMSLFPPPPTITAPADGTVAPSGAIGVRGTALPESTITLKRDGRHYRDATVNVAGEWQMDGVVLDKGENILTASVTKRLFSSPASNAVHVTFPGGEMGVVPTMSPAIDPTLDPHAWMVELALEQLDANGATFYAERRAAFTAALRAGLQASKEDNEAHRFVNLDVPLTFDKNLLVFLVPKDIPEDKIIEAFAKALESAVLDKAVRQELMLQITASFERMDLAWTVQDSGQSFTFEYVRIELDQTYLLEHFDPRALAKFRTRLATELITGLLGEVSSSLAEKVVQMGFALWGRADADTQAQHYYDLAIRAWNHRDIDGAQLPWDDPANNAFDGDMGYTFATNEEWAMFYLGRASFYVQSPADPYYTIPYYKPEADLYAFMARKGASELAKKLIEKKVAAVFGRVLGAARPITQIFTTLEIFDWMTNFLRYTDAREVRDVHRPNFGEFVTGSRYDYSMPDERKQLGALNERAGYPFRGPNDFMLHSYLDMLPLSAQERGEHLETEFPIQPLIESQSQELTTGSWAFHDLRWMVRDVGEWAIRYIHPGRIDQTDKRIPEGDMIVGNPYFIREAFSYQAVSGPPRAWPEAEIGSRLRLVLLDGTVIEGRVDNRPVIQPVGYLYYNSQTLIENEVLVYVVTLNELSYIAGTMTSFPYRSLDLIAVAGDGHLYAVFERLGGSPVEIAPGSWPDLMYYLVGVAGNGGPAGDFPEKDGAARIAAGRLVVGALATQHLLGRFAAEAPAYKPPPPIVVGLDDLGVALGSPAQLHLYDRRGRHVGPNPAGGVDLGIPGGRYFTQPETGQQFIVIPHADLGDRYEVRVDRAGDGTFNLDVFYTDRSLRQAVRLAYENVPLNPDTVAELSIRADNAHTLRVDHDGNGSFDQELPPSRMIEVAVFEVGRAGGVSWLGLLLMAILAASLLMASAVVIHRRRRQPPFLSTTLCPYCGIKLRSAARFCSHCGRSIAICPRCSTPAKRPDARFCQRCGSPLPAAVPAHPLPLPGIRRRVSGRLVVALGALVVLLCFFLPWVDCSGLQTSGWHMPRSVGVINFQGGAAGLPSYLVYLVPLSAAMSLLMLRWRQRKIAGGLTILIAVGVLLFVVGTFLSRGALACSRPGLWGTLVGLIGMIWGGVKEVQE